jgi:SAM-dependent methyltransferase
MNKSWQVAAEEASWAHYYDAPLGWYAHVRNVLHHVPLLRAVLKGGPRSVLEIGSGTGSLAIALSYFCPGVLSLDLNPELVERCERNNRKLRGRARFGQADAFDLSAYDDGTFDVACSQGFFEHFDDEQIAALLQEQTRVARRVVLSVPNDRYGVQDFGNERLLTKAQWDELLTRLGGRVLESKNYSPFNEHIWKRPRTMYLAVVTAA